MRYLVSFIYGAILFNTARFFPLASLSLSLVSIFMLLSSAYGKPTAKQALFPVYFSLFTIMVIAASGFYYAAHSYSPSTSVSDLAGETIEIQGIIRSEATPLPPETGLFSQVIEIKKATDADGRPLDLREMRIIGKAPLTAGMAYIAGVSISKDASLLNPGSNRKVLSGYVVDIREGDRSDAGFFARSRLRLNSFLKNNFSAESAPFLMSIVTGERGLLSRETNNAFNVTGLAHILSISGSHFGMLFFFLFSLSVLLTRLIPYRLLVRLTLYLTPRQIAAAICMPFVACYLGISDMSFPAVRSFIMIILFLFGLLLQRKGAWLNTLLFAAVIIVIIRPDSVLDLSFQLSFVAVLCIGLVTERQPEAGGMPSGSPGDLKPGGEGALEQVIGINSKLRAFLTSALQFFRASVLISLVATAGTAPLVSYYFHYFSLVSPLTNLIITPIIGFVILPLALVSSFVFLVFDQFPLLSLIDGITTLVLALIKHIARWPSIDLKIAAFPSILIVMFYLGLLLYIVLKSGGMKKEKKSLFLTIAIAIVPIIVYSGVRTFEPAGMQVTFLAVGEGDAAVVELPGNKTIVSDTGKNGLQVAEFLRYRGIKKIEAVMLSHGDSDHAGGWTYLRDNFPVSELWDNGHVIYEDGIPGTIRHRVLQRGDVVEGEGYSITALHPYEGFYSLDSRSGINNDSLVVKIQGRKNSFMLSGDIEKEGEENVSYLGKYLKSSVLKVPHHGSRSSASGPFFSAVAPEIAVISVGRKNFYKHPHTETLEMLSKTKLYRTDTDGAIGVREMPDGSLRVRTARDFQFTETSCPGDEIRNIRRLFLVW